VSRLMCDGVAVDLAAWLEKQARHPPARSVYGSEAEHMGTRRHRATLFHDKWKKRRWGGETPKVYSVVLSPHKGADVSCTKTLELQRSPCLRKMVTGRGPGAFGSNEPLLRGPSGLSGGENHEDTRQACSAKEAGRGGAEERGRAARRKREREREREREQMSKQCTQTPRQSRTHTMNLRNTTYDRPPGRQVLQATGNTSARVSPRQIEAMLGDTRHKVL